MSRRITVLAVCGFGVGTSLILRMNIEKVLKEQGIDAEVINADITTGTSINCDIIFTSKELYTVLEEKTTVPLVEISNFMSNAEIAEKGLPIINEILKNA
jgi:PTS system ascorbate-specific IIB component